MNQSGRRLREETLYSRLASFFVLSKQEARF